VHAKHVVVGEALLTCQMMEGKPERFLPEYVTGG